MPYITSGQLKSLAVSTAKRSSALPNVPTVAETGIGDFDLALWIGVFVPRATPRAVWEQAVSSNAHDNAGAALIGVARKLLDHPGLRHLLSTGHTGRVWVKRCGAYSKWGWTVGDWIARLQSSPARQFRRGSLRVGKRLPHTQFESVAKYPIVRASLDARLPHPGERRTVLVLAPASLFQF